MVWAGWWQASVLRALAYQVIDKATGLVVPFLPGAEKILQPTGQIGQVVAEQTRQIAGDDYLQRMRQTTAMLREAGTLLELDGGVV